MNYSTKLDVRRNSQVLASKQKDVKKQKQNPTNIQSATYKITEGNTSLTNNYKLCDSKTKEMNYFFILCLRLSDKTHSEEAYHVKSCLRRHK